jgi:hypothetical protein
LGFFLTENGIEGQQSKKKGKINTKNLINCYSTSQNHLRSHTKCISGPSFGGKKMEKHFIGSLLSLSKVCPMGQILALLSCT